MRACELPRRQQLLTAVPSVLLGYVRGEGFSFPARRRLTACVIAGCAGHASVHCDSGPRAWGSGERARCVFHSSSRRRPDGRASPARKSAATAPPTVTAMTAAPTPGTRSAPTAPNASAAACNSHHRPRRRSQRRTGKCTCGSSLGTYCSGWGRSASPFAGGRSGLVFTCSSDGPSSCSSSRR